jgi:hypothetical protein
LRLGNSIQPDRSISKEAIQAIATEYANEPVEWLEINHWPDSGRLIVYPSQQGPHGDRDERICCQLISDYLKAEWTRIGDSIPANEQKNAWALLGKKVWDRVGECLRSGEAAQVLKDTRKFHRFRLATFDYDFGEGLFRLSHLDPDANAEMQRKLTDFKRRYGILD